MKRRIIILGLAIALLITILFGTDPTRLPAFVLIAPFLLLFVAITISIEYALQLRGRSRGQSLKLAAVLALLPLALVVMQSIGQLTVRDIITVIALFAISYFYVWRSTKAA